MYSDGDYTLVQFNGPRRWLAPFPNNEFCMFEQDCMRYAANWAPAALDGSVYQTISTVKYYLIKESDHRPEGPIIRWTRTYCKIPATWYKPEGYAYNFIGITIALGGGAYQTRTRQQMPVQSRVQMDYFLVPSNFIVDPILGGAALNLAGPGDIPTILDMKYVMQGAISGATYGGLMSQADMLNLQGTVLPTWPTSDQYQAMISDALQNEWGATVSKIFVNPTSTLAPPGGPFTSGHNAGTINTGSSVLGGIIPVEQSKYDQWIGPLYVRQTRYALAQ